MSLSDETSQVEQDIDIFNDGRHIFEFERTVLAEVDFSVLSEPPLGQGSTIPVLELSRILKDYDMDLNELPRQQERLLVHKGLNFNLMVAGPSGMGKRTFINSLFDTIIIPSTRRSKHNGIHSPEIAAIECYKANLTFGLTRLNLRVVKPPEYGGKLDNSFAWIPLVSYIDEQIRSFIFQKEQPNRELLRDNRIHCCLYFIPPTNRGMSALDIVTMKELSRRVNLIPIIAKADAFNGVQLENFKEKIRNILQNNDINVCRFFDSKDSDFADIFCEYPFDIISSNEKIFSGCGNYTRCRKYKWGSINVEDPSTSKFNQLKKVIFDDHFFDFITSMESYYARYRALFLKDRISKARQYLEYADCPLPVIKVGTLDIIRQLNFDNVDDNRLLNYSCYEIFNKKYMDLSMMQKNPGFIQRVLELKRRMSQMMKRVDQEYEKKNESFFKLQLEFNQEIEIIAQKIKLLQVQCTEMESQLLLRQE